jgi:2-amino-4-hydroxy-6-hydroxymethyldihydropteridine diphosphokinase
MLMKKLGVKILKGLSERKPLRYLSLGMKLYPIFILLGSNLGNRKANLEKAALGIENRVGLIKKRSSLYETKPWGKSNQPDFLNQVVLLESNLPIESVLDRVLEIEQDLGRKRDEKWGARLIDIDLLYAEDRIIDSDKLSLPHPGIPDRRFVLQPLVEIAPDFVHPALKKTNWQLLEVCRDILLVKKL